MKWFVLQVLLALVAMAASQVQVVDHNPDLVQVVDYNPDQVQVNNNPEQVQVVDNPLPYDADKFVLDPAFGRPGVALDPAFGRPGVAPGDGSELIHKEPAYIYPPTRPNFPKRYDNPAWRSGK